MLKLIDTVLALDEQLPPIGAMYQYVVAGNGLFVRAEDSRIAAMAPVAHCSLRGLVEVESYARLKVPRIPVKWLESILVSARRHLPKEVLYQFTYSDAWRCTRPAQRITPVSVEFDDVADAVIDLHSHNSMDAFYSDKDNRDEAGLRFYAVIGRVNTDRPEIALRAGVYGYPWPVSVETVFEGPGPFVDVLAAQTESGADLDELYPDAEYDEDEDLYGRMLEAYCAAYDYEGIAPEAFNTHMRKILDRFSKTNETQSN